MINDSAIRKNLNKKLIKPFFYFSCCEKSRYVTFCHCNDSKFLVIKLENCQQSRVKRYLLQCWNKKKIEKKKHTLLSIPSIDAVDDAKKSKDFHRFFMQTESIFDTSRMLIKWTSIYCDRNENEKKKKQNKRGHDYVANKFSFGSLLNGFSQWVWMC